MNTTKDITHGTRALRYGARFRWTWGDETPKVAGWAGAWRQRGTQSTGQERVKLMHRTSAESLVIASTRTRLIALLPALLLNMQGCAVSKAPTPSDPCDQECVDAVALRALRETVKLVYNKTLQGKPAGAQDAETPCLAGAAHVYGQATPDDAVGATRVTLTYEFDQCTTFSKDDKPERNYQLTLSGTVLQDGTMAVLSTATMALRMTSASLTLSGTVYDPSLEYEESSCGVDVMQNGNNVSGLWCGRQAGFSF